MISKISKLLQIFKEKKGFSLKYLGIFVLVLILFAGIIVKFHSNNAKYNDITLSEEYKLPKTALDSNNSNNKTSQIFNKFDLMPAAAEKAALSVVHISMDRMIPRKQEHKKFGVNIYKPLHKNYQTVGSGVIVTSCGYILTNNHVVENLAGRIKVEFKDGTTYRAQLIGRDPKTDLAVIKINVKNLSPITFANSDKARVGDIVLAIGNPFGIGESVSMGIISAIGRSNIGIVDYEDFIQTDAAINPGNSGGALVNLKGELIGINTAILTKGGGYEGIAFAIPSNMALMILKEILTKGKVERGWIGMAIQNVTPQTAQILNLKINSGIIILDVASNSPAEISGLQKDDILLSVNGIPLMEKNYLRNFIANSGVSSQIKFKVLRGNNILEIPVKISKLPDNMNFFDLKNFSFPAR